MTTTDTGTQLLAAILADPGADDPRLLYADWLDENPDVPCPNCGGKYEYLVDGPHLKCPTCDGDGTVRDERRARRAELIRVGVELAALVFDPSGWTVKPGETAEDLHRWFRCCCTSCQRAKVLRNREHELLAAHGAGWARVECPRCFAARDGKPARVTCDLCPIASKGDAMRGRNPQWSRGFVVQVECRLSEVMVGCRNCDAGQSDYHVGIPGDGRVSFAGKCPVCSGAGQTPAPWLAAVFRAHPTIERVVLTDREPLTVGATLVMHEWHRATWDAALRGEPDYVPDAIFAKLRGFTGTSASHNSLAVRYHTHAAARLALAVAVADAVRAAVKRGAT